MWFLVFKQLLTVCSVLLTAYLIYFGVIAVAGLIKKAPKAPAAQPKKKFACVVAARNEAAVIGNLVDSLKAQAYPAELFDIIVAPNNCTDDTEAVAQAHGARIFHPQGPIHSKGEVLTQVVDDLVLTGGYDAMCVFDADNLAGSQFLARMNDALCSGARIAQGFRDSKNPEQTAISGCYSICYWMLNRFYNTARAALGLSALVNGSGFAVSTALLQELGGWHTVTMTEDYEFSAQCALYGERVHFVPDAVIFDEQPLTFAQSWRQRRRWTTGSLQGLQEYGFPLFRQTILRHSFVCFDMFLTFLTPFAQLFGAVLGVLAVGPLLVSGSIALGGFVLKGLAAAILLGAAAFVLSILGTVAAAALTVLLKKGSFSGMWRGIAAFWVFAFSHTVLTLLSFVRKETKWLPIAHTSAKTVSELESR